MSDTDKCQLDWSYDDPSEWCKEYPDARGQAQSPIDIIPDKTRFQSYQPFVFSPQFHTKKLFLLTNDGHIIFVTLAKNTDGQSDKDLWIRGGGLIGTFYFVNFHVHWGPNDGCGAEHQIDGHKFPAEGHFVFKNSETGQMAVLGVLFGMSDHLLYTNNEWEKYADAARQLIKTNDTLQCLFILRQLLQIDERFFFRYSGSLTTPPCTEGIVWTIFAGVVPIQSSSLNQLRQHLFQTTHRPLQPINDRIINRSF